MNLNDNYQFVLPKFTYNNIWIGDNYDLTNEFEPSTKDNCYKWKNEINFFGVIFNEAVYDTEKNHGMEIYNKYDELDNMILVYKFSCSRESENKICEITVYLAIIKHNIIWQYIPIYNMELKKYVERIKFKIKLPRLFLKSQGSADFAYQRLRQFDDRFDPDYFKGVLTRNWHGKILEDTLIVIDYYSTDNDELPRSHPGMGETILLPAGTKIDNFNTILKVEYIADSRYRTIIRNTYKINGYLNYNGRLLDFHIPPRSDIKPAN